jgi:hypothetical protein
MSYDQEPVTVERHVEAIQCKCGGYAGMVEPTTDEERRYGCGRPRCCSRAFVCNICGMRRAGRAEAPEME